MAVTLNGRIMDTTKPSEFSISASELAAQLRSDTAPLVIDVRKNPAYLTSEYTLPSATRRDPLKITVWIAEIPMTRSVVVYCVHGHEVSQGAMSTMREHGIRATYLQGGIEDWRSAGLPLINKSANFDELVNGKQV
jgi:rhodanese-related sulfurtransferase